MTIDSFQLEATRRRFEARRAQRERNLQMIAKGQYLKIDSPDRVEKFLVRRGYSPQQAVQMIASPQPLAAAAESAGQPQPETLERVIGTSDLMAVAFLDQGLIAARTVGRVWMGVAAGKPIGFGTGFLVSPNLLMTNHHVLGDKGVARASLIEFDYQVSADGTPMHSVSFGIDADTFHVADRELDYAVVAVRPLSSDGARKLSEFGYNRLIEAEGKAITGQWLNIIQHPNGEPKQLALRENNIVDVLENFVHYHTDTAPGSSGSPVYNDQWEVVALHHSGVPWTNAAGQILAIDGQVWREDMGEDRIKWIANEGVRISRVLKSLHAQPLSDTQRQLLEATTVSSPDAVSTPPGAADGSARRAYLASNAAPAQVDATVNADGVATWTIPISLSIRVGQAPVAPQKASLYPTPAAPVLPAAAPVTDGTEDVLAEARRVFGRRADVLKVQLGFVFRNGWITKDRAIVVTVRRRQSLKALDEAGIEPLPATFRGLPVEVTNPTLREFVRALQGPTTEEALLGADASRIVEEITYQPPQGVPLDPVTDQMRVIAHASPDNGWPQLRAFVAGTKKRLVVGMYDFGAPHIVDEINAVGSTGKFEKLTLAMQKGQTLDDGVKADDLTDQQTVDSIREKLGAKFENSWVKIGPKNGWVAYSYHIKVAVRDHSAFWLSSGNWQSSNQPDHDPLLDQPAQKKWLLDYNREWHAIVEHPGLAKTFETYLLNDFEANRQKPLHEALRIPDLLIPGVLLAPPREEAAKPFQYFPPFDKHRTFTVRPLLTPDNFRKHVRRSSRAPTNNCSSRTRPSTTRRTEKMRSRN